MLPLNKSQIPKLLKDARALEARGQLADARRVYDSILKIDSKSGQAHFQIGQICLKAQDFAAAHIHFGKAAKSHPKERAIWELYARAAKSMADPAAMKAVLSQAKRARVDPKLLIALQEFLSTAKPGRKTSIGSAPPEQVQRVIQLLQSGVYPQVVTLAQKLRQAHPNVALIADLLANGLAATGQAEAAEKQFRAAQTLDPNYAATRLNYGRFLVGQGRNAQAADALKGALTLNPKMTDAMVLLGVALKNDNNMPGARIAFEQALKHDAKNLNANFELGQLLVLENAEDMALRLLITAQKLGAPKVEVLTWIARAHGAVGNTDQAAALFDTLSEIAPDSDEVLYRHALFLQSQGEFTGARELLTRAIQANPKGGHLYLAYVTGAKVQQGDPIIAEMQVHANAPDTPYTSKVNFGFALAKALEDIGAHDQVFAHLRAANDLVAQAHPYDFDPVQERTRAALAMFQDADFDTDLGDANDDFAPIFVTGLPRSGTTLVEQIVASHSAVTAGGELGFARQILDGVLWDQDGSLRRWNDIPKPELLQARTKIQEQFQHRFGAANHVTDKSVQSYNLIGPIRAVFPKARVIVVKRDPRDNLLSMYKNLFATGTQLHSYTLRDLARYYHLFQEVCTFWEKYTPDWVHFVQYEDLIADPDTQARALIQASGLDWEDACLAFYENKRSVSTLSVHQVRQPLYSSSIGAWKRYESELSHLLHDLGDAASNKEN